MAMRRLFLYVPRLGQIVCMFLIGTLVGHYLLGERSLNLTDLEHVNKRYPHFKCVEISRDEDISEVGVSLDTLDSVQNVPDVAFDAPSGQIQNRAELGDKKWRPETLLTQNKSDVVLLSPGLVTNVVHYLWCEVKIFEFQHYLSVLSVVTHINPERIIFHYGGYPRHDTHFYNTWFEDMKKEFLYIALDDLTSKPQICSSKEKQMEYINELLKKEGGIYVHFNTIFMSFPLQYRKDPVTDGLSDTVEGFLVVQQGVPVGGSANTKHVQCLPAQDYRPTTPVITCAIKKGPYRPRDAWDKVDDFSKAVNLLMYGESQRPRAGTTGPGIVPNIGHLMWLDGTQMPFLFFLNCLSYLHILKVDRLYIHGNSEPSGKYWEEIKKETKVTFVKITKPDLIFRHKVNIVNHMSDVFRGDVLYRYGGIYSDTDSVWIKQIPEELRHYDVVASYDWPQMYSFFPDYINFGATLSKPGAPFWQYFLHSFKDFKDMFGYNGLLKPYKIYERHPELVHIYDKLQVMCWELRCHPTWYPDFRNKDADHHKYPDFNWREAHLFHFTDPTPKELTSEEAVKSSDTMFAEIGKVVLRAAGRL